MLCLFFFAIEIDFFFFFIDIIVSSYRVKTAASIPRTRLRYREYWCYFTAIMADEVQRLRDLVSQLEADNEQLQRERTASRDVPGGAVAGPSGSASYAPSSAATVTERLVVVPRDRKCPLFNGKTGVGIAEWTEEIEACMRASSQDRKSVV